MRLEEVFESFDMCPMASASIGQVHAATLKTDSGDIKRVVVKVQHKDIVAIMWSDIKIASILAKIASYWDNRWEVIKIN